MRAPDCGDGPPQLAPCVPDTLNIPDVGTAYLKYTCKDAAKYLRCSQWSWGWDMAVRGRDASRHRRRADGMELPYLHIAVKLTEAMRLTPDGRWAGEGCPGKVLLPALSFGPCASRSVCELLSPWQKGCIQKALPPTHEHTGRAWLRLPDTAL